jgi:hypothetical protein
MVICVGMILNDRARFTICDAGFGPAFAAYKAAPQARFVVQAFGLQNAA